MMAAVAKYRDDIAGSITTAGISTAYTVATSQVLDSLRNGFRVAFSPHVDCGAAPTLAVDGLAAKPLRPYHAVDFAAGELKQGAMYSGVYNSVNGEWIVDGYFTGFLTSGGNPDLVSIHGLGAGGTTGMLRKTAANTYALDEGDTAIIFEKDNSGTVIPTGIMGDAQVPFACTILSATMLADQSGSAVVDIWKAAYANYPPLLANSIVASAPPTITTATKMTDATLTGWTTAVAAGDCLRFNLNSVTSITRLTIILKVKRF